MTAPAIQFLDHSAEIACPACQANLVFCDVANNRCVGCPECKGLLLTGEIFAMIVETFRAAYRGPNDIPKPLNPDRTIVQRLCPACGQTMDSHPYYGPGNVEIDACRECQLIWIDRDELGQIVRAPGRR